MASRKVWTIGFLVLAVIAFAGYLLKAADGDSKNPEGSTNVAAQTDLGIIDMNKALKAHPKYKDLVRLNKEFNTLKAQNEEGQDFAVNRQVPALNQGAVEEAAQQKENEKITAKRAEIKDKLKRKYEEVARPFAEKLQGEVAEIDQYYQPLLFDLKLKLETIQMQEEARNELNQKRIALENERNQKVQQKQKAVDDQVNAIMQAESQKAESEFSAYANQIAQSADAERVKKQTEITERNTKALEEQNAAMQFDVGKLAKGKEAMIYKEQEIHVLEESIKNDIASKVAKIAIEKNLTTVLTTVEVNIHALDITDLVVAEFNK
ncbi:hypothetical protein [Anaerosinus massiliensis]|uniref:hypothetical protein n=1 Tax=Massilibacillus massiliensis TaxID=1806837 RepID=UPI000DA62053|nr:hypothetical protein [Massilibacillus massiliensis]